MKKPKDAKTYYALTGGAILLGAAFLYWQSTSLAPLRDQAATLGEQAKEQEHVYDKLEQAKKAQAELQASLAHLEQGVPTQAYVPTMLKELALAGKQMGVEVTGIRPVIKGITAIISDKEKAQEAKKPYQELNLEMKGRCGFNELVQFVSSLDHFPKVVMVRTLGVTPPPIGLRGGDRRLDFTLGLRAFVFKDKDVAAKAKGPEGSA